VDLVRTKWRLGRTAPLLIILACPPVAYPQPVPRWPGPLVPHPRVAVVLPEALPSAELIVTGRAESLALRGEGEYQAGTAIAKGQWITADFAIDHVVNGACPSQRVSVLFFHPTDIDSLDFPYQIQIHRRSLAFLKRKGDAAYSYELTARVGAIMRLSPTAPEGMHKLPTPFSKLTAEWLAAVQEEDPEIAVPAFSALRYFDCARSDILPVMQKVSSSRHPNIMCEALKTRLWINDWTALDEILSLSRSASVPERMVALLGGEVCFVRSPDAVPRLKALLNSPNPRIRHGACYALSKMGMKSLLPTIAQCLSDPHGDVSFQALVGLIDILVVCKGLEGTPRVPFTRKDHAEALKAWTAWWEQKGKPIYGTQAEASPLRAQPDKGPGTGGN